MTKRPAALIGELEARFEAPVREGAGVGSSQLHDFALFDPVLTKARAFSALEDAPSQNSAMPMGGRWETLVEELDSSNSSKLPVDQFELSDIEILDTQRDGRILRGRIRAHARLRVAPDPLLLERPAFVLESDPRLLRADSPATPSLDSYVRESAALKPLQSESSESERSDPRDGWSAEHSLDVRPEAVQRRSLIGWFLEHIGDVLGLILLGLLLIAMYRLAVRSADWIGFDGIPANTLPPPFDDWARAIRSRMHPVTQIAALAVGVVLLRAGWGAIRSRIKR